MITITYARKTTPSATLLAEAIEDQGYDVRLSRGYDGDVNWGRNASSGLNSDISNVTNKRIMRELFRDNDVPMPRLYSVSEVLDWHTFGSPIVGRPDTHSKGRGFWKCHNFQEVDRAIGGIRYRNGKRKAPATHFMEFIDAPREYRVHIFKGLSMRLSEKDFSERGETAVGEYTTRRPNPDHNIEHVREAAKKAVEAVGLDFGCVDILADNENCWVLEVNSAPHLGGSLPRVYAEKIISWYEGDFDED